VTYLRAVVQRVTSGSVTTENRVIGQIGKGLVVLLGIGQEDEQQDIDYLADKIVNLRIFEDENGKMNTSLLDIKGELLIVSQFTLYGDCRKGKRPSYDSAARPESAQLLYNSFVEKAGKYGLKVETGKFQADMLVQIQNDGPVTLMLDSKKLF
jgi:D-tyrosyl-tRNA(Tyr) deacylase